ncbi:hypothetical protein [Streptomyces sp. NPDC005374]|uniref:hypothetical protein n=1 Tax=Streptomyces sp. NPDC005374 TaxID=3364713 RepID=UPI0036A11609
MTHSLPLARIRDEVERFRNAIQTAIAQDGLADVLTAFQNFPRGSCGKATAMLCIHLQNAGLGTWLYVMGRQGSAESGYRTHAWAARGGIVLDITGSQFPDRPDIWLDEPDDWFARWEAAASRPACWSKDTSTEEGEGYLLVSQYL